MRCRCCPISLVAGAGDDPIEDPAQGRGRAIALYGQLGSCPVCGREQDGGRVLNVPAVLVGELELDFD
jgi:hypothetical protein